MIGVTPGFARGNVCQPDRVLCNHGIAVRILQISAKNLAFNVPGMMQECEMEAPESLLLDLLETLRDAPKPYREVMEAWRTSCPMLPVWEDAVDLGLVSRANKLVMITNAGRMRLATRA